MSFRVLRVLAFLLLGFRLAEAEIPAGYYNGTEGLSDQALIVKLRQITGAGYVSHSYDNARAQIFSTIDREASGTILCIYTGNAHTNAAELNIEHIWPQSRGADAVPRESDCHHLRPTEPEINNRRSNLPFGWVTSPDYVINGTKIQNTVACEPRDPVKGDIARAIFYFATRYDYPLVNTGYVLGTSENKMGFEDVLRHWNTQDPVSDGERARNDRVYTYQLNRNPFVDHPEFVERISTFAAQPTPTASPTRSPTASVTPTPTPGPVEFDLSGYMLHQFNSTQSYTFPAGTRIQAGGFLILTRSADRAAFEQVWSVTLSPSVGLVSSGDLCPQINGGETYELVDPGDLIVDGPTQTGTLNALTGHIAVRATTDSNSWSVVTATQASPGTGSYAWRNAGVVITKFGEPTTGSAAEFVELYFDALPGPTATPTPSPTPSLTPTPVGPGGYGLLFY